MSQLGLYSRNPRDLLGAHSAGEPTSPDLFYRQNMPRLGAGENLTTLTTEVMTSVAIKLAAGDVVTNISVRSGATAANTPTNYWVALYSSAATPALLRQSADQTSTAWAANTTKTLALATAYTVPSSGIYWVGIMVKATATVTLLGQTAFPALLTGEGALAVTSGSSLAATAPATIASPTAILTVPRVVIT